MERLSAAEFLAWANAKGLGRDPRYPHSETPTFLSEYSTWYRIRPSEPPEPLEVFVGRALHVAAAGTALTAFPPRRTGAWGTAAVPDHPGVDTLHRFLADAGLPPSYIGALRFGADEVGTLTRAMAAAVELDCMWELTIVPEHGRCAISSDEDGVLMAGFPDDQMLVSYLAALARAGWQEPVGPDRYVSETDPWLDLPERSSDDHGGGAV